MSEEISSLPDAIKFPKNFIWGTATAAYQIEGAVSEDGRVPSIWDVFCQKPGAILTGENADIACDHYHQWQEDIELLAKLGVRNYRLSLSWPRLFSEGIEGKNDKGFEFYDRIIDTLLEKNITPWITLYHWDLPQILQERGGWQNRAITEWFAEYAEKVVTHFADRVKNWCLINEPSIMSLFGHGFGWHAPGLSDPLVYGAAVHHINLSIATAYDRVKRIYPDLNIGSTWQFCPFRPRFTSDQDAAVAADLFWNRIHLDPLLKGHYPEKALKFVEPFIQPGDLEQMKGKFDFFGAQTYGPIYVTTPAEQEKPFSDFGFRLTDGPDEVEKNGAGWAVDPGALKWVLDELRNTYGNPPTYITENGYVHTDTLVNGKVDDAARIHYMERHISQAAIACQKGSDLRGYFYWSLMDNFEWADGYDVRFGLIYVDYKNNCHRIPKASYYWYKNFLKQQNGMNANVDE